MPRMAVVTTGHGDEVGRRRWWVGLKRAFSCEYFVLIRTRTDYSQGVNGNSGRCPRVRVYDHLSDTRECHLGNQSLSRALGTFTEKP